MVNGRFFESSGGRKSSAVAGRAEAVDACPARSFVVLLTLHLDGRGAKDKHDDRNGDDDLR